MVMECVGLNLNVRELTLNSSISCTNIVHCTQCRYSFINHMTNTCCHVLSMYVSLRDSRFVQLSWLVTRVTTIICNLVERFQLQISFANAGLTSWLTWLVFIKDILFHLGNDLSHVGIPHDDQGVRDEQ